MKPVGYLIKYPDGLQGERGLYYDYILASTGVWIEAEGKLMAARAPVSHAEVRGLAPLEAKMVLRYGRIPQRFFDLALSAFLADTSKERYVAITWGGGQYHLRVPEQEGTEGSVQYAVSDSVILDLHSHGKMSARFSGQDNRDEQGLKLYGVLGTLDVTPRVLLRFGVYGYFHPISWGDVFDGSMIGVEDFIEQKEVIDEDELHSEIGGQLWSPENSSSGMRWNR